MKRVQLRSAEPTEDEEAMSALHFGELRLDPVSVVCVLSLIHI